jgi:hypothetical protein
MTSVEPAQHNHSSFCATDQPAAAAFEVILVHSQPVAMHRAPSPSPSFTDQSRR